MSEAGKYFNFFATTATAMLDSDPIDVAASHTKATSLYHAIPSSEGLLLFSDQTQFKLEHPTDTLSNSTVAVKPLTEFEASTDVPPVGVGKNVFFVTPKGQYAHIMEYFVNEDTSLSDAANITGHVPRYVAAGVHSLVASGNEDVLLVLSAQKPSEVSVYKYLWNNNEKLQSAWFKWVFGGDVLGAAFMETQIFFIIQYPDGLYLEVMDVQPGFADPDSPFEFLLDRKLYETDIDITKYDPFADVTTLTLPYSPTASPVILTRPGGSGTEGEYHAVLSSTGNTVEVRGDLSGLPLVLGTPIRSTVTLSHIFMRDEKGGSGAPVLGGRLQLRSMHIYYKDSGRFTVTVEPLYRQPSAYTCTGRILSHGANKVGKLAVSSGTFTVPILSKADQVLITITSTSPLPFHFVNAEWEGFFNSRSRRL